MDLVLHDLQWWICHKTKPNQTILYLPAIGKYLSKLDSLALIRQQV